VVRHHVLSSGGLRGAREKQGLRAVLAKVRLLLYCVYTCNTRPVQSSTVLACQVPQVKHQYPVRTSTSTYVVEKRESARVELGVHVEQGAGRWTIHPACTRKWQSHHFASFLPGSCTLALDPWPLALRLLRGAWSEGIVRTTVHAIVKVNVSRTGPRADGVDTP
jgi:hypothetical protein